LARIADERFLRKGRKDQMGTRHRRRLLAVAPLMFVGVGVAVAATAVSGGTVKAVTNSKYGSLLATASGMTLYHMTSEKPGTIKCTGGCVQFWPPLLLGGNTKPTAGSGVTSSKLGTIRRPDGRVQVTYNGMALYRYSLDKKPGDVKGQGVEGIWFAVTPAGKLAKAGASAAAVTTTSGGGGYG
jgi:predicted lipoprotein with Yx(FWY)xxD motif